MNANELADKLENKDRLWAVDENLMIKTCAVLRQQQAEIEALKLQLHTTLTNRDLRTYDGKLDMNNEPVAWAVWEGRPHDLFFTKEEADELCRLKGGDAKSVPLYTHPAKTLTDEEINVVAILQDAEIVPVGHEIWKTDKEFNKYKKIVLATAKALRKAQEK